MQNNPTAANTLSASGLTLEEACKILNVSPPMTRAAQNGAQAAAGTGEAYIGKVHEQFRRLFDMNDPKKGGSFYLQSKVLRARERIELEVRAAAEKAEREEELRQGWKPKVYNDR
jgi:import inner membrane translocase subunit TIM16